MKAKVAFSNKGNKGSKGKKMKYETTTILTLDEIKKQNYEMLKSLVMELLPATLTEYTDENLLKMVKNSICALPDSNATVSQHIQFWLDYCSDKWYSDKWYEKNKPDGTNGHYQFKTNVVVQYVDSNGKTHRKWVCCEDPEIF